MMRFLRLASCLMILAGSAIAADVSLTSTTAAPGSTATITLDLAASGNDISLVLATISYDPVLGIPVVTPDASQASLLSGDVFVDDIGPANDGIVRICAFVRSLPNLADGETVQLDFDLTGVPIAVYPISISTAEVFNVLDVDEAATLSGGSINVSVSAIGDWMILEE